MNIYISGVSGTGMGPLALMAKQAGYNVCGSDLSKGAIYNELINEGIEVFVGEQDGEFLSEKLNSGIDWFVYTSALPEDHPELVLARKANIKCTKRDDLTAFLVDKLNLKMVAVAGTHGKTTTTAMIIWTALKKHLPVSYIVGTTLGFAPSGAYHSGDKYFIYEADEYDRNFLKYHPWLAVIPAISYDHPDIYLTEKDYVEAFEQFKAQSERVIENTINGIVIRGGGNIVFEPEQFKLAGSARRLDACLAAEAIFIMASDEGTIDKDVANATITKEYREILNKFPGVGRRFERLRDGVYTDYAHHPEEIAATIDIAREEAKNCGKKGLVVIYQPHQNTRQHMVRNGYKEAFLGADRIIWLPTYLTRENTKLAIIMPNDFIRDLENADKAESAELNDDLENRLRAYLNNDYLLLLMAAGPADEWFRDKFLKQEKKNEN